MRLFDGKSTYGWVPEGGSQWHVESGVLKASSGPSGWLRSAMPFSDFILRLEFRTGSPTARSGVLFRAGRPGAPSATVFNVAIQDEGPGYPTGSLVGLSRAPKLLTAPSQWKSMELTARGSDITVSIDGNITAKVRSFHAKLGYFGLQYTAGSSVEFRNIRAKPLDFSCITTGRDLIGFRTVLPVEETPSTTGWTVHDGAVHAAGGPGQLETEQAWDDLLIQVDVRVNHAPGVPESAGGIFFRGVRNGWRSGYAVRMRTAAPPGGVLADASGSLMGLAPAVRLAGKDNAWMTLTVLAVGRDIAVWIDGELVVSYRDMRPSSPNSPLKTARLMRGTTGFFVDALASNLDFRNYCIKRMNR